MLKILVAPLDWGLGHATRCIPIIKELIIQRHTVIVAATGAQKAVLQEEFPALCFVEIPGYGIKYTKNRAFTALKIISEIPKILIRIKAENRWLRGFLRQTPVDLVISDNRYGLYAPGVDSIFITHQLAIRTGLGRLADAWLRRINYRFIQRFMACWVPDAAGPDNLAGKLSHPLRMPAIPVKYIGWLSRFRAGTTVSPTPKIDLLILLSGPEPQRTMVEQLLLAQLEQSAPGKIVLVRGLPGGGRAVKRPPAVDVHDYMGTEALAALIAASNIVLSRPGYSTVMDLAKLDKRAIFIPTPGQTEQEYLGHYLAEKGYAVCRRQRRFSLREALEAAERLQPGVWPRTGYRDQSAPDFG